MPPWAALAMSPKPEYAAAVDRAIARAKTPSAKEKVVGGGRPVDLGAPALVAAVKARRPEIVARLLEAGAKVPSTP